MSTRGLFGFVNSKNQFHAVFSGSDSYVDGLGFMVLEKLIPIGPTKVKYFLEKKLEIVEDAPEDQLLSAWELMEANWSARGKKFKIIDAKDFMKDGLFCEYAYIYDCKKKQIRCYKGGDRFATIPMTTGLKQAKELLVAKDKEYRE